jgi:phosphohistidine phosphatase
MKTLLILRHAKSSWKQAELADHDRPLNKRGKRDAPRMGDLLRSEDLVPDLIISSTARRARKTAEAVAQTSGYDGEITLTKEFYLAGPDEYLQVLSDLPDEFQRVLVVGHNPGLEELLELLTDSSERLPTAALAQVKLDAKRWRDVGADIRAELLQLWHPRELS